MKFTSFNYDMIITIIDPLDNMEIKKPLTLKAPGVNREQALKIAAILYPNHLIKDVRFKL